MFRCDVCHGLSKPGEKMTRVVVETRPRTYHNKRHEAIGVGSEVVREEKRCSSCAPVEVSPLERLTRRIARSRRSKGVNNDSKLRDVVCLH